MADLITPDTTLDFVDISASRDEGNGEIFITFEVYYDHGKRARKEVNYAELTRWKQKLEKLQPDQPIEVRIGKGSLHFWWMDYHDPIMRDAGAARMFGVANVPPREYDVCKEPIVIVELTAKEWIKEINDGIDSYAYECFRFI